MGINWPNLLFPSRLIVPFPIKYIVSMCCFSVKKRNLTTKNPELEKEGSPVLNMNVFGSFSCIE